MRFRLNHWRKDILFQADERNKLELCIIYLNKARWVKARKLQWVSAIYLILIVVDLNGEWSGSKWWSYLYPSTTSLFRMR